MVGPTAEADHGLLEGGAAGNDRPALRRCLGIDVESFAELIWGRQAHLSRREQLSRGFDDLLTLDAVDHLVSRQGLRTPFLRVARAGSTLPNSRFTRGGGVGAAIGDQIADDALTRLFVDGSTIVLQGLHRTWSPVIDFAQQLAADLGHPVQANAYVTPPQSQGFSAHYDVHDVFVLQVAGQKRWVIHFPVLRSPLRDQPWTDRRPQVERAAAEEPVIDTVLRPGDCLYLPRGFLHSATALGETSAHLTLGVHVWTRRHVLEHILAELSDDQELRESLPLGLDPERDATAVLAETVRLFERALPGLDVARVAERMRAAGGSAARAEPAAPIAQAAAIAKLDGASVLRWRAHLAATLTPEGEQVVVRTAETTVRLPGDALPAVRALLDGARLPVAELPGPDDVARLELARTLLGQALAVLA